MADDLNYEWIYPAILKSKLDDSIHPWTNKAQGFHPSSLVGRIVADFISAFVFAAFTYVGLSGVYFVARGKFPSPFDFFLGPFFYFFDVNPTKPGLLDVLKDYLDKYGLGGLLGALGFGGGDGTLPNTGGEIACDAVCDFVDASFGWIPGSDRLCKSVLGC